ncbi:54S ribosomal protein RML2, mitochondrial [Sphaceloma murrayae]|uniref:Large ribosomal subunit protein uL2m n=1 Tax=Sphaceloma murrayae TaxID=2082308 RepID=A0A2K1QXS5_9PEZI|nr:54S ribosomal protein RML2, mitochondrial [Sphaceloma murrayae]
MLPYRACLGNAPKRLRLCSAINGVRHYAQAVTTSTPSSLKKAEDGPIVPQSATSTPLRKEALQMRTYKPKTPGLRHLKRPINTHLWKGKPLRALTFVKVGHGKGGRNHSGRITVRHRGGGHRRRIRTVDFVRMAPGPHKVERIEYDPNRTAHLALLTSENSGDKSYIIAAEGMRAGDVVESFRSGIPRSLMDSMGGTIDPGVLAAKTAFRGNCLPIHMVPIGTQVFNVGSQGRKGAVFCRSAGTFAMVVAKEESGKKVKSVTVRLQSGEVRTVASDACATVGVASNPFYHFGQLGKAGRSRWLNIRPTVRGLAMNACKYILIRQTVSSLTRIQLIIPTEVEGSGYKTRLKRNPNKFVVKERVRNQGKRRSKGK